jgi:hypothetical protein
MTIYPIYPDSPILFCLSKFELGTLFYFKLKIILRELIQPKFLSFLMVKYYS